MSKSNAIGSMPVESTPRFVPGKIQPQHQSRLAIVYVRQSSPQQVEEHKESLARQYALKEHAVAFGWHSERILVIDQDLGLSGRRADNRKGFQKLLAEVTMEHVGMVLGLEMSRLARSCKDWHHLIDLCGIFDTLLADQDGVYDPSDPNDRLLLGLKGTLSEVELHTMRNRLERGKLNKAKRGELFLHAPNGFVKDDHGQLILDPDEQVRAVVQLVFDKYTETGSFHAVFRYMRDHDIRFGVRPFYGPDRGKLVWRTAALGAVSSMLRNPTYAGAYSYGRFSEDPKSRRLSGKRKIRFVPMDEWQVLIPNKFPGYITWEQFLENRERARQNRTGTTTRGSARGGGALLAGMVYCEKCGVAMVSRYNKDHRPRYECHGHRLRYEKQICCGVNAAGLDQVVADELLRVVEPGAIELAVRAIDNLQQEHERLDRNWQQNLERARYESANAERCYRAVDPENRLVARTLEEQWEAALRKERAVVEEYERFKCEGPDRLTEDEAEKIRALSTNLPELWNASSTTNIDKQEVARSLIERVTVAVPNSDENAKMTITWAGGATTEHTFRRPVFSYQKLEHYEEIREIVVNGRKRGFTNTQIADQLNEKGFRPPAERSPKFTRPLVAQLAYRLGITAPRRSDLLGEEEWWLREFGQMLGTTASRVRYWVQNGYINWRRLLGGQYVVWADEEELSRLKQLRDWPSSRPAPDDLTQPKLRADVAEPPVENPAVTKRRERLRKRKESATAKQSPQRSI